MSLSVVAACGLWLVVRARGKRRQLAWALLPLVVASAPLWANAIRSGTAVGVLSPESRTETFAQHLAAVLPQLHRPLGGVLGTHTPVVADDPEFLVLPPGWVSGALVLLYGVGLILAARSLKKRTAAGLLFLAAGLTLLA